MEEGVREGGIGWIIINNCWHSHDYVPMHSHIPHPEHHQVLPTFVSSLPGQETQGRLLAEASFLEPPTSIKIQEGDGSSKPNIPGDSQFSLPITLSLAIQNKLIFHIYLMLGYTSLIPRPFHPSICCVLYPHASTASDKHCDMYSFCFDKIQTQTCLKCPYIHRCSHE